VSGTGAAFLSDVRLDNGQPAEETLIRWLQSPVDQTVGVGPVIEGQWTTAQPVRVICVLGLNCPAGTQYQLYGKRPVDSGFSYDIGFNVPDTRTVELPDGRIAIWAVLAEGLDDLIGVSVSIVNSVGDAAILWADANTELAIGEIGIFSAVDLKVKTDPTFEWRDPSQEVRDLAGGIRTAAFRAWRELAVGLVPSTNAKVRGEGYDDSQDWEKFTANAMGDSRCCAILDYSTTAMAHRTAVFGKLKPGGMTRVPYSRNYWEQPYRIIEAPTL
jgi:hypothetical protein